MYGRSALLLIRDVVHINLTFQRQAALVLATISVADTVASEPVSRHDHLSPGSFFSNGVGY